MRLILSAALVAVAMLNAGPVMGQAARVCVPEAAALQHQLGDEFGEVLTAAGADLNGNLVQVYSSDTSGTWTIAITLPGGPTCIVSSGDGWIREPGRTWAEWARSWWPRL